MLSVQARQFCFRRHRQSNAHDMRSIFLFLFPVRCVRLNSREDIKLDSEKMTSPKAYVSMLLPSDFERE